MANEEHRSRDVDLMYAQKGVGLAANQVDLPYRFFILNAEATRRRAGICVPQSVIGRRSALRSRGGCLSFPKSTPRETLGKIVISAYNLAARR